MRRLLLLTTLLLAALAAPASAATVGGAADDPIGDGSGGRGSDVAHAEWTFDADAGRLSVSVTFAAAPTASEWGMVNVSLLDRSAAGCDGSPFATVRGSNRATDASGSAGSADDGPQPDGRTGPSPAPATNVKGNDGWTTTLGVTHARLVGRAAGCVSITISHNGVLDAIVVPAAGTPGGGGGTPPSGGGTAPAAKVRLASSPRLRFARGAARVTLAGVAKGMIGRVRVVVADGTVVASGRYVARAAGRTVVRIALTPRGRSWLRAHPRGAATLSIRSTFARRAAERSYRVTLRLTAT